MCSASRDLQTAGMRMAACLRMWLPVPLSRASKPGERFFPEMAAETFALRVALKALSKISEAITRSNSARSVNHLMSSAGSIVSSGAEGSSGDSSVVEASDMDGSERPSLPSSEDASDPSDWTDPSDSSTGAGVSSGSVDFSVIVFSAGRMQSAATGFVRIRQRV